MKLPFATAAEFVTRYRENVTRGGVYLRAKKVLPPGTLVNLDLKLTSGERLIHGSAMVHFVTGQDGTGPSGLGLKFLELDDASKKFIDEMLAGHPAAFTDTPPVPPGVSSVQYADKPKTDTAVTSVMSTPPQSLFGDSQPIPMPAPGGSGPPVLDPVTSDALPPSAPSSITPAADPFGSPVDDIPLLTPVGGTPAAPPSPAEVMSFPTSSASAPASPPEIDSALLDRLEVDSSDPRAVLGLRPSALPDAAGAAAGRMKADLHLDEPGDPVTTRLRRILARRLDTAVEALVRPAAKDSPALAEVSKQDPATPFVPKETGTGKRSSPLMSILLLLIGLGGGFAGALYGGPMLGLTGTNKPVLLAKAEPAKTEPAKAEPAKVEPAKVEPAKVEPAKVEPAATAVTEPAKTEPATTVAAAEPAKTEPAKVELAKTEPAKPKLSPAEEKVLVETQAELLKKVEAAMGRDEPCMPFLIDLGDVVATSPRSAHIGLAIILRARCFDAGSKSTQARAEYKKYTKWFPKGPYIDEARDAN